MARTLTANTTTKTTTALGTEPNVIIKVEWSGGTDYYGYKTFSLGAWSVIGNIIDFSTIASQGKQDESAEVSDASVVLDDSDGSLKTIVDTEVIEGTAVTIYHHYEGLTQSDLVVLLKGKIAGDIVWDEGQRTLSFTTESVLEDDIIGYAPAAGDFTNLSDDAIGVVWPLCFGTVLKVPAVKVKSQREGLLKTGINSNFTSFDVENGSEFTQSSSIQIAIGNIWYTGSFSGDTFTVTSANDAHYSSLSIADRPTNDTQYNDASVVWLYTTSTAKLKGLYCIVNHATHGWMLNYCVEQEGRKCTFIKPWRPQNTTLEVLLKNGDTIYEAAPVPRSSWNITTLSLEDIAYYSSQSLIGEHKQWISSSYVIVDGWSFDAGQVVRELNNGYNTTYVANLIPSTEILEVFGNRTYDGEEIFVPIPSSYYTKNLSDSLGSQTPTTLEFEKDLLDYVGEDWKGDVFVSLRSSVGPNAAQIIKWLLQTYSNLSVDSTTFNSVIQAIQNYPANFMVDTQPDVIDICEEIAWQARCALYIANDVVYIIYLSATQTSVQTIDETVTLLKSLQLSFTSTEDIYTRLTAKWFKDYSGRDEMEKEYNYENNISTFGLRTLEKEFYIYNIQELVEKSADFWGYRYSNSWRQLVLDTFLTGLELTHFDCITADLTIVSTNTIKGILENINHNAVNHLITLEAELASKAGDVDGSNKPQEDNNYFTGDPSNPVSGSDTMPDDPGAGREEIDYDVPTQGQVNSDPNSDSGGSGGGVDPTYYLQITTYPPTVERGQSFQLVVRLVDYLGNKVYQSKTATLSLVSSDGSDALNTTNISLVGGEWSSSSMTITGGSGSDTGTISVAGSGVESDTTGTITIIDALVDGFTWTTSPSSVTRDTTFSVQLDGASGSGGKVVTIELTSNDPLDKLYDTSGEITTVELDTSGTFSASDWYISGGQGSGDFGTLTAIDAADKEYDDKACDQFSIAGSSPMSLTQAVSVTQTAWANRPYLALAQNGDLDTGTYFELGATMNNSDDTTYTSFNGTVKIIAYDDDTDAVLTWASAGYTGSNHSTFITAPVTSGTWSDAAVSLNVSTATTVRFEAVIVGAETIYNDSLSVAVGSPYFTLYADPDQDRGVAFDLTITAYTALGAVDTTYVPTVLGVNLTLSGDEFDGETIDPTSTDNSGWSNGVKTVSVTISDGSGGLPITINATDASSGRTGAVEIGLDQTVNTLTFSDRDSYAGFDTESPGADATAFATAQVNGYSNFNSDSTLGTYDDDAAFRYYLQYADSNYYGNCGAGYQAGFVKFTVTASWKTNIDVAALYCSGMQSKYTRYWTGSTWVYTGGYISDLNTVQLEFSESNTLYSSGSDVRLNIDPDYEINFSTFNQYNENTLGKEPWQYLSGHLFNITIPGLGDYIKNMTGNDLYIWFCPKLMPNYQTYVSEDTTAGAWFLPSQLKGTW